MEYEQPWNMGKILLEFTINIPPMLAYIPYMDAMGLVFMLAVSPFWAMNDVGPGVSWLSSQSVCFTGASARP